MTPPSLLLRLSSPRFTSFHPSKTPTPTLRLTSAACCPPPASGISGRSGARVGDDDGFIPIARCYEGNLARLELTGAARREQAVAAAAATDGGASAEAHLAAGTEAMVVEAFLPGAGGRERSAASTRVILQAKEIKEKANKLKESFGADLFSGDESDSKSILSMAFKQVVMEWLLNFRLDVFTPGSERDFQDFSKPQKSTVDFSIISSDDKLLSALAESIWSCVVEDERKNYCRGIDGLFRKWQRSCSADSSICLYRISEEEVVKNAKTCLENFNLVKSSHSTGKSKHEWWPASNCERLGKIGGPEFVLWANEFVPSYRLQIDAKAFENTKLEGRHELIHNSWEILLAHFQLAELGNVLDMYFEDQFTLPGKAFLSHWNLESSNIPKNNVLLGNLNNLFTFLASSCVILIVGIAGQLCWPQLFKDRSSFVNSSYVSSSQNYCSGIHSLDNSELQAYCISVVTKIKDSVGWPGDVMVDANVGAWVGELPDCFKGMNHEDNAASDDVQHSSSRIQEDQHQLVPTSNMTYHLETNDDTRETLQDIASFQVVISGGKLVGFQPTSRVAVNHWATNPLAYLLYEGQKLSPGFIEPRLKISRPAKVVPIELLISVNLESFFALARPIRETC